MAHTDPQRRKENGRLGALKRFHPNDPRTLEAEAAVKLSALQEHIKRVVDEMPPLTPEQRASLAEILSPSVQ